jgi:hypothetical protein
MVALNSRDFHWKAHMGPPGQTSELIRSSRETLNILRVESPLSSFKVALRSSRVHNEGCRHDIAFTRHVEQFEFECFEQITGLYFERTQHFKSHETQTFGGVLEVYSLDFRLHYGLIICLYSITIQDVMGSRHE